MGIFTNKTLLITGGTGSFGNAVADRFIDTDIGEIRIFSRDEKKQDDMRKKYSNDKLKFYIGDVRNRSSIQDALRGVDFVFHAAALKQVPSCEFFPMEAVQTNVIGTKNVLSEAIEQGVSKVVCLSTDKAAYPINAMGISKAMMEKVAVAKSRNVNPDDTTISITRYGNVMASRGSVIPLFYDQITSGKPLTLTNGDMTRFMMTLNEAVDLVLYAFEHAEQGDLFIKKAPAATIDCLADAMVELFGDSKTPYGYGGPIIQEVSEGKEEELVQAYAKAFKDFCEEENIVSEFVRFHPVLENHKDFESVYDIEYYKKTTGTNLRDFDDPFQKEFSKSTRKRSRRALRDGVTCEIVESPDSLDEFIEIYYETMDRNDAADIYYFDREYFDKCLDYFSDHMITIKAVYEGKTIAMGTYFVYEKFIHSHLFGTLDDYLDLSPAYAIGHALTEWGKENSYHLVHDGGGTSTDENDSLYRFKKKFGQNTEFDYYLAKQIWNHQAYEKLCERTTAQSEERFPAYRS